jgi:hypothetical protein
MIRAVFIFTRGAVAPAFSPDYIAGRPAGFRALLSVPYTVFNNPCACTKLDKRQYAGLQNPNKKRKGREWLPAFRVSV